MKYKLLEDFAGKKAGEILYMEPCGGCYMTSWNYKNVPITITSTSELLEEVKDEPLFYTNEDEVYLDGNRVAIYLREYYYFPNSTIQTVQTIIAANNYSYSQEVKRFATKQAAEDYIKLQQAIKDSGLKIGGKGIFKGKKNYCTLGNYYPETRFKGINFGDPYNEAYIEKFVVFSNEPVIVVKFNSHSEYTFLFRLIDFTKPKLLFGDKEVKLSLQDFETVAIECQGEAIDYLEAKKFRDAITTIQEFKFGSKSLSMHMRDIKIGCTTGTLEQIDKILLECERMLKS